MIKSKRIWLFQMPILDEMKMTDRAAEIEVQQILAQGNNAQQNRVTFHPLRQIFAKFLPAAQRHGQGLGCNVVLLLLWGRLAFGLTFIFSKFSNFLTIFKRLKIFKKNSNSQIFQLLFFSIFKILTILWTPSLFGIPQTPESTGTSP